MVRTYLGNTRKKSTFGDPSLGNIIFYGSMAIAVIGLARFLLIPNGDSKIQQRHTTSNRLEATVRDMDVLITDRLQGRTYKFTIDKQGTPNIELYEAQKQ